ncbi:MAG: dephospho-CoA kinase [Desulfobacterales bacterium GWB2_56_26]|nr:MAG: dephospho-CoA kinase [Desulfobacterales bacterium GWB2_56_26]
MIIAVTGSLGSGKSTASKILAGILAAEHVDTDQLCRMEMLPGRQGYEEFRKIFGTRYLNADGSLNRMLLRHSVFNDSRTKTQLENILHPLVRGHVADLYRKCQLQSQHLVVEVPLLFEVGWQQDFDVSVVVYVPDDLCLARVRLRDALVAEDIRRVFAQQLPIARKRDSAHFVIDNTGTFVSTVSQLAWLGKKLKCERKSGNLTVSRLTRCQNNIAR